MTGGAIGVVFGVGFFKLRDGMGRLAELIGVIEVLVGLFCGSGGFFPWLSIDDTSYYFRNYIAIQGI